MTKWVPRDWQYQCFPRNDRAIVFLHCLLNWLKLRAIRKKNLQKNHCQSVNFTEISSNYLILKWKVLIFRKIPSNWRKFWKWQWFFSLGRWHWFLAISKFSLGKKVNAKKWFHGKKVFSTIKFFPLVYLVNHVEIEN